MTSCPEPDWEDYEEDPPGKSCNDCTISDEEDPPGKCTVRRQAPDSGGCAIPLILLGLLTIGLAILIRLT